MSYSVILNSALRTNIGDTPCNAIFTFDWGALPQNAYVLSWSIVKKSGATPNIYVEVELGQSTGYTTLATATATPSSRTLGIFLNRCDVNTDLHLCNRPSNNFFNVRLMDYETRAVSAVQYDYVLMLNFRKI